MKKLFLSLALLLLLLCGCGDDNVAPDSTTLPTVATSGTTSAPAESTVPTYNTIPEYEMVEGDIWEGAYFPPQPTGQKADMAYDERLPQQLRDAILKNRYGVFAFDEDIEANLKFIQEEYLHPYDASLDEQVAAKLAEGTKNLSKLTTEQAVEDITFLFDYLKVFYAGYGYLGGDAVFEPIMEQLVSEVQKTGDPTYRRNFALMITRALFPVMKDAHFAVDGRNVCSYPSWGDEPDINWRNCYFYFSEEYLFDRDGDEYYTELDGEKHRLVEANKRPPKDLFKLTIAPDGLLKWMLAANTPRQHSMPSRTVKLVLQNEKTSEYILLETYMKEAEDGNIPSKDAFFTLTEHDGLPGMAVRRMSTELSNEEALSKIAASAEALREEPVFCIDIRGNPGGSDHYPNHWMQTYLEKSEWINHNNIWINRESKTRREVIKNLGSVPARLGWNEPRFADTVRLENESLIFVLTNNSMASAAEGMVDYFLTMDNVILIGTNTGGVYTVGSNTTIELPNSGVSIFCGVNLVVQKNLVPIEGKGYQPDIWVSPDKASQRVAAFVEFYGLAQ